jgi:hypothetical protein
MKKLFHIFAKLLGLYQLYTALMGSAQIVAILTMMARTEPVPLAGMLLGAAGILIYLTVAIAIAWVLLGKTEWLAKKVGIHDDVPVEGLEHVPALAVGICLIGIYVTIQSLPDVVRLALTFRNMWDNVSIDLLWPQLVPSVLQLALGLFLALQPGRVAGLVARTPRP